MSDTVAAAPGKISPLHSWHQRHAAHFTDFAGWQMPLRYRGILEEHRAVRSGCGVFDISHMGEIIVCGPLAAEWLDSMLSNAVSRLPIGRCHYTLLLNETGGILDDLILARLGPEEFFLVVNAATSHTDTEWLMSHLPAHGVALENASNRFAALAIQGPSSPEIFEHLFGTPMPAKNSAARFHFNRLSGIWSITGYTGEKGFEAFFEETEPRPLENLMEKLTQSGVEPCGLGARDLLRLEMGYPLYGSDLDPTTTPLEAGLEPFVALDKPHFIGRDALLAQKRTGLHRKLRGLLMEPGSPPPRAHYPVCLNGESVAQTTSGALSPSLKRGIALAYLPIEHSQEGAQAEVEIRGKRFPARITGKAFYKPSHT